MDYTECVISRKGAYNDQNIGSGTALGLIEYLDNLVARGRASTGAVTPLKTAFMKVIEAVDGKDWQQTQIESINVDDYVDRFANLTRGAYTEASIAAYKSRMSRVIGWYKKFMAQPGWMPLIKARAPRKKAGSQNTSTQDEATETQQPSGLPGNEAYSPARTLPSGIMVVFPKYMDAQVSFGSFGEELRSLDTKGMQFAIGDGGGKSSENSN